MDQLVGIYYFTVFFEGSEKLILLRQVTRLIKKCRRLAS